MTVAPEPLSLEPATSIGTISREHSAPWPPPPGACVQGGSAAVELAGIRSKMSGPKTIVMGVLTASMCSGCSYDRNIREAGQNRTLQQPHADVIDHFVPHTSTELVS